MAQLVGEITQIIGPVVDISFEQAGMAMPSIHDALEITRDDGDSLIVECQQHIGENTIRAIAMDSTDGLRRGMGSGTVIIETAGEVSQWLLDELKSLPPIGLREKKEGSLIFSPQVGTEVSDIISLLAGRGVKIERATRQEATLEEMYTAILREVEPV